MNRTLSILVVAAAMACAPAATTNPTGVRRQANVITQPEVQASFESNAYDVVNKLRPMFLKTRGRTTVQGQAQEYASVFLDDQYFGDLNSLRNIAATQIQEIRYYPGTEVATKFGMQYGAGVIAVKTR
ncbi:MAG TPA: hypothetical protein VGD02_09300 [Gemmatimonadaceae bacterium]|jgi:hypothetical protein